MYFFLPAIRYFCLLIICIVDNLVAFIIKLATVNCRTDQPLNYDCRMGVDVL
jgi:hypothetical protein